MFDDAVEMDIDEVLAGRGAPVAEEHVLDVLGLEGLAEEGVVVEIDLADGEVIGGSPVGVDFLEEFG